MHPSGAALANASGDFIQMLPNAPKMVQERVCNSHLPIRELQVHIWGMRMGAHGHTCVSRITKCRDFFCCSRIKELKAFFQQMLSASFRLKHRGFNGRDTSFNNQDKQQATVMQLVIKNHRTQTNNSLHLKLSAALLGGMK